MATWAKGIDFKNSGNTARIGGIGVYGTDTASEKIYIGLGTEPWSNAGLQLTTTAINFKGNKIYHAGDKPTLSELGAAASSHTHNYAGSSSAGGAANTAVKLGTARTLTIGSTGKTFDGSANVSWSLTEIGAAAASHSHSYLPLSGGTVSGSSFGPLVIKRSDSTNAAAIVFSNTNGTLGSIGMTASKNGGLIRWTDDTSSNYTILDTGNYKSFVTPASIGAAASSHSHSYLPLSGGTLTGAITIKGSNKNLVIGTGTSDVYINNSASGKYIQMRDDGGLTYSGNKIYHAGDKPTLSELGAAAASHNHDVLISAGGRIASADIAAKGDRGLRMYLATSSMTTGKPAADGYILNFDWDTTAGWSSQMYIKNSNSPIMQIRGMNAGTWGSWYTLYSTNNKPTPAEIGAAASSHTHSYIPLSGSTGVTGTLRSNSEIQTTSMNAFRAVAGNYGFFVRNDGSNTWFMLTNSGDQYGSYNSLRPMNINNSTGLVTFGNGLKGTLDGNASTATKLATSRTIALSGDASGSASFDGSANATISATVRKICFVGSDTEGTSGWYKVASQTMSGYGDTNITFMVTSTYGNYNTGILQLQMRSDSTVISCKRLAWLSRMGLSTSHYIIVINGMSWTLYAYQPLTRYGRLAFEVLSESGINGKNSGFTLYNSNTKETTAPTATVTSSDAATVNSANLLTTARTINGTSFNGGSNITTANWGTARTITIGSTGKSVNGSANVSWSLSEIGAAASSHTHNYAGSSSAGGAANSANTLATARTINGTSFNGSANITTANWGTARTITIGSTGKSVNGSGNVSWSLSEIGAAAASHSHNYLALKGTNTITSTTNDTTSNWGAQGNSVHWYNTAGYLTNQPSQYGYLLNIGTGSEVHQLWMTQASGNLAHRGGNGSGWSGTWKVILDSSNYSSYAAAASHTHNYAGSSSAGGAANSATVLATARTINGTSFNGSANITTANWGTARTITVGSTAKSVNGSANIGWTLAEIGAVPSYTGSSTTIHADSDASSTSEYLLLKAGHNELKIASSAGGTTVTKGQDKLTFNGNIVYHAGRKPTPADISAVAYDYSGEHLDYAHPRIFVPGKEWLRAPSGGLVPYKHQSGYLGLANKAWYDFHTVHINSKPIGGSDGRWWNIMPVVSPDGVVEVGRVIDFHDANTHVGDYTYRLHANGGTLYHSGSLAQMSDRTLKENIAYIDEKPGLLSKDRKDNSTPFKDFIKDFRFATFNYKEDVNKDINFGFIAQDIKDSDVGKLMLRNYEKENIDKETSTVRSVDNVLAFDVSSYITIVAKALQEEIKSRDEEITQLKEELALMKEKLGLE